MLLTIGIISGCIGSIFGLGGGIIIVPLLVLAGENIHSAIAASLFCILMRSVFSNSLFLKENKINIPFALLLSCVTVLGSFFGAAVGLLVYDFMLKLIFAVTVLLFTLCLLRAPNVPACRSGTGFFRHEYREGSGMQGYVPQRIVLALIMGAVAGFLGGMLGVGGGSVLVPVMTYFCRMPIKIATATSSFIISFTVYPALLLHLQHFTVESRIVYLVAGAVLGTFIGKKLLDSIKNRELRMLFVIFNALIAASMFYSAIKGIK